MQHDEHREQIVIGRPRYELRAMVANITCTCGWYDRAYANKALQAAERHNEMAHRGNYPIVGETS